MWQSLFWCKMRRAEGEDPRTATDGPQWRSQVVNFLLGTSVSLSICHNQRGETPVSNSARGVWTPAIPCDGTGNYGLCTSI